MPRRDLSNEPIQMSLSNAGKRRGRPSCGCVSYLFAATSRRIGMDSGPISAATSGVRQASSLITRSSRSLSAARSRWSASKRSAMATD
jgi:hypothetical protein